MEFEEQRFLNEKVFVYLVVISNKELDAEDDSKISKNTVKYDRLIDKQDQEFESRSILIAEISRENTYNTV